MRHPLAICLAAATLSASALAQEFRGTWIARDGLGTRAEIVRTLDDLQAANFNTVCVNVWSRGYTIHPSAVLQRVCGVRQDPTFIGRDPLQEFLVEAHRRGIEVHAWFEYGFVGGWSGWFPGASGSGPVLGANPSWAAVDRVGNRRVEIAPNSWFYWMSHENPDVQRFLTDLVLEVVDRYDVDGIQLDRIRYPSLEFGYDAATVQAYRQAHAGASPPANPTDPAWERWRADRLSAFVARVAAEVRGRRSNVLMTSAPIIMPNAYDLFLQDWTTQLAAGSYDYVHVQVYRTTASAYRTTLRDNLNRLPRTLRPRVVPGIRAVSGTPTNEVLAMVAENRSRGLLGHVFWYMQELRDDLTPLRTNYFQTPVPVPARPRDYRPEATTRQEDDPTTTASGSWFRIPLPEADEGFALRGFGGPTATVRYAFDAPASGLYHVQAHGIVGGSTAAPDARIELVHGGGTTVEITDQAVASGWRRVATVWLDAGMRSTATIRGGNGETWADAVEWLPARFESGRIERYGAGTSGASGAGAIGLTGQSTPGGTLSLQGSSLAPAAPVVLWFGIGQVQTPSFGGDLWLVPLLSIAAATNADGLFQLPLDLPRTPSLVGASLSLQLTAIDPSGPSGVVWTPAVAFTFG